MKAVVVEDSEVMQNMLRETLERLGIATILVQTPEEGAAAIAKEHPNLVVLDVAVAGGTGMTLLDRLQPEGGEHASALFRRLQRDEGPGVVVLRENADRTPDGSLLVRADLVKPFTKQALLAALEAAVPHDKEVRQAIRTDGAATLTAANPEVELERRGLSFGESYVFFQEKSKAVHAAVLAYSRAGYGIMLVTAGRAKVARERFGLDKDAVVFSLSASMQRGSSYPLGTLIDQAWKFIADVDHPVVAIDDLDNIIEHCGLDRTFEALHEILAQRREERFTLLVSVDGESLTRKDQDLLTEMMTLYTEE